jgi:hypothetical protein
MKTRLEVTNRTTEHRRGDIKMGARETGISSMNWIYVAKVRDHWRAVVNMGMNLPVS